MEVGEPEGTDMLAHKSHSKKEDMCHVCLPAQPPVCYQDVAHAASCRAAKARAFCGA